jgi:anti-sigma regulatory factor (Ser/Thr protein kinase)
MEHSAAARKDGRAHAGEVAGPTLPVRLARTLGEARDVPLELLREPGPAASGGPAHGERGTRFGLRFPRVFSAVSFVRNDLRRWLENRGLRDPEVFDICLACSEIVANAVQHPVDPRQPAVEVGALLDESGVLVVVHDFGSWRSRPAEPNRGRGLPLASQLMDELAIEQGAKGTTVFMLRKTPRK